MATEKDNINKPTRKRKKARQGTEQQAADAPTLTPIGAELAQNADDEATGNGAKASREWDPHMGARQDTPKSNSVPAQTPEPSPVDSDVQQPTNVSQRTDGTYNDEASDRSGAEDNVILGQGVEKVDGKNSENSGTISQGGVDAAEKKSDISVDSSAVKEAKMRERYDAIQRENAALQRKKVDLAGISGIVKADSASAEQLTSAVDAIDAKVAENDDGIAQMFADDAQQKSQQKKQADDFALKKQEAEAIQAVKDIDWSDDAQVSGLDKETVRVAMADAFPDTRVDLWNRPHVPAEDMRKAGYDVPDGQSATVYTMGFDVDGKEVLVTPIVDNGDGTYTVMSEDELARYVGSLNPADPESDELGLVISWDSKPDDGEKLHRMQEAFYATPKLVSSNGERVEEDTQDTPSQDSEEKGTPEEKGGDGDAENDLSFWMKPKAAVEPYEPYLDLKSADEYGISEENGEDVEEEVEGGTISYKDYSKADREAYAKLNEEEKKNYDEIKSYIAYYEEAIKKARDDNKLAEVLEANRAREQYEAKLAEYNDPDKLKKLRARRKIAVFADVLAAIANMWGAYRGAKPIELKSATGNLAKADAEEDKSLRAQLKELEKIADNARKEADKEIARLDKVDAAEVAAVRKRLWKDFDKWDVAQRKEIENAKKKRDTANQKSRDAQWREILAKNNQKRTQENIDYRADVSDKSDAKRRARADEYKQKAEGRAEARHERQADKAQQRKKEYYDYTHGDEE